MSETRFFIDHGVIHDRVTGKHVRSYDVPIKDSGEDGIEECCALMNELSGACGARDEGEGRNVTTTQWTAIETPLCDICGDSAKFRHPLGGLRCWSCRRPEVELCNVPGSCGEVRELPNDPLVAALHNAKSDLRCEFLGRSVREALSSPKPHHLLPLEEISEADREVDRRIGETLLAWHAICRKRPTR